LSWIYVRVNSFKVNKGISREQRWRERERETRKRAWEVKMLRQRRLSLLGAMDEAEVKI
jgi:hypothetical protein